MIGGEAQTLAHMVSMGTIQLEMRARDKQDAIDELVDLLYGEGKLLSKERFVQAVTEREAQVSTSVGHGIAIPHGKSDAVKETSVAIGRSARGITWDSGDPEICRLIILLAVSDKTSNSSYLQLLANFCRALIDDDFRGHLMTATSAAEVLERLRRITLEP